MIGTKSSDAIDDTTGDAAQTVKTLRKVNYIVSIGEGRLSDWPPRPSQADS